MKEKFESQLQSFTSTRFKQHRATALSKAEMHIMQRLQVTAANMRRAAEAADATVRTSFFVSCGLSGGGNARAAFLATPERVRTLWWRGADLPAQSTHGTFP